MRIEWRDVEPVLTDLAAELAAALQPKMEKLREEFPFERTETIYEWIKYGPYGIRGFKSETKKVRHLDCQAVLRTLTEAGPHCIYGGKHQAQLTKVLGCMDSSQSMVFQFAGDCIEHFNDGGSWQDAVQSFKRRYFDETVLYGLTITCPIFNLVIGKTPFVYEGHGMKMAIRRPMPDDFRYAEPGNPFSMGETLPDAILRLDCNADETAASELLRNLSLAFSLYSPSCIACGQYTTVSHRFRGGNLSCIGGQGSRRPRTKLCFRLSPGNAESVRGFLDFVLPHLLTRTAETDRSLALALDAYRRALGEPLSWNRQVAEAVMGVEALLMGDGHSDLKFKASYRTAKVCSALGYDPLTVRNLTLLAYDVRSAHVHGSSLSKENAKKTEKLSGSFGQFSVQICDIVRSLTLAMIVTPVAKVALTPLIDDSFLSQDATDKLTDLFAGVRVINRPFEGTDPFYDHFLWHEHLPEEDEEIR